MSQLEKLAEEKRAARRSRAKARADEWAKAEYEGFIDFYVTTAEWEQFDALDLATEFIPLEWLQEVLTEGLKFNLNRDKDGNYVCSLYAQWKNHPCAGMIATAFAESPYEAMAVMWFKHSVLCGGDFTQFLTRAEGAKKPKRG